MVTATASARPTAARSSATAPLLAALAVGTVALVAVHLLLAGTYWDYSEGVYALTAHLMLHGRALYTSMAGAQPPGVFLAGAGLLAVHDSLEWLRLGVGCLQLGAGLIAAWMVLRITASRTATALTAAGMLLTPWAVHEHGALTPELVALPCLLGAAALVHRPRWALAGGVVCGLLPAIKLPLAIPALVLIAVSADRRRTMIAAAVTALLSFGLTTALAGASFWRDIVVAQTQTGARSLSLLEGFWAQTAWNVVGLLVGAVVAVRHRQQACAPRLLGIAFALAGAMIVTFLTNVKQGTGLNVTVPVEAALVPVAICGTVFAFRHRGARPVAWLCAAGLVFTLAQSVSLIASPRHAEPFLRAGSRPAWAIVLDRSALRTAVAAARRCPAGAVLNGPPLIAFLAGRPMPAGQPDQFIITHSRVLAPLARRAAAATPRCP